MDLLTILWIMIGIAGLTGVAVIVILGKYKHRIRIKQTYGNKNFVIDDKFREVRKKEGVFWKLLKTKVTIQPAPDTCIEVTKKGRMSVTAYEIEKGAYVWQKDDLKAKIPDKEKFLNQTQPMTTTQRTLIINQAVKAEREKKKTATELLFQAAPIMAMVVIVVMFLLLWGDAVQPIERMADKSIAASDTLSESLDRMTAICNPGAVPQVLNAPIPDPEVISDAS